MTTTLSSAMIGARRLVPPVAAAMMPWRGVAGMLRRTALGAAPRCDYGTTGWIATMKAFLLGNGWATAWYLVHYVLLWPLWGFYAYFRDFKPGAGPQGGEAIAAFMIMYVLAVAGVALFNGIALMVMAQTAWWMRFLVWPLGLLTVSTAVALCVLFTIKDYAAVRHGTSGRVAVGIGVAVFAVVFLGANFSALAKVRG